MEQILGQWRWHAVAGAVPLLLLLIYLLLLALAAPCLPERIAVHFNAAREADGWLKTRSWAAISTAVLMVAALAELFLGPEQSGVHAVVYWLLAGMLWGSFLEVLRVARFGGRFQPLLAGLWALLALAASWYLCDALRGWWQV